MNLAGTFTAVWRLLIGLSLFVPPATFAGSFSVASYNLELYFDQPDSEFKASAKSPESKAKIRETLKLLNADVVALQEISTTTGLRELQASLKREGLDYPFAELMPAADTKLRLAFLSRLPIQKQFLFTNETYLLRGKKQVVSRGFFGIQVQFPGGEPIILNTHLKSRRQVLAADEEELREHEALKLRERVNQLLVPSRGNLMVVGDFNDSIESRPLKIILGRGANSLHDIRPAERNGDSGYVSKEGMHPREVVWTHYFGANESYSRVDYILTTTQLATRLDRSETYIATVPDWGVASDHRAIKATFDF